MKLMMSLLFFLILLLSPAFCHRPCRYVCTYVAHTACWVMFSSALMFFSRLIALWGMQDPTVGARNDTFTPKQQTISPNRFARYGNKAPFFDSRLNQDVETLPPQIYAPSQPPPHAAGITSADMRRMAKQPAT